MFNHHFRLGLVLLAIVGTSSALASDIRDLERCGGYYACVEFQPSQQSVAGSR